MLGISVEEVRNFRWKLKKVLPGQRDAALLWSDFCDDLLKAEGLERSTAIPALYRLVVNKKVKAVCVVHVDDLQFAGFVKYVLPILKKLGLKVKLQIEGPFLTEEEREAGFSASSIKFLKRKYTFENGQLKISSDPKYSNKLCELLNLWKRKPKQTSSTSAWTEVDNSPALSEAAASNYRSAVGVLLYLAHDRPDIQFATRHLATGVSAPTKAKQKQLEHLALYVQATCHFHQALHSLPIGTSILRDTPSSSSSSSFPTEEPETPTQELESEHLLELFTDSDWAGCKASRRSVSSIYLFLNGVYLFSFSRTQKSIALSSAEAEYLALTSGTSEALGLAQAVRFLTNSPVRLKAFTDSRQRHLCKTGSGKDKAPMQQAVKEGQLSIHSVPTAENPADLGTKPLTARRTRYLLNILRFQDENGPVGQQERAEQENTIVVRRLERAFRRRGFLGAAVLAALARGGEGSKHQHQQETGTEEVEAAPAVQQHALHKRRNFHTYRQYWQRNNKQEFFSMSKTSSQHVFQRELLDLRVDHTLSSCALQFHNSSSCVSSAAEETVVFNKHVQFEACQLWSAAVLHFAALSNVVDSTSASTTIVEVSLELVLVVIVVLGFVKYVIFPESDKKNTSKKKSKAKESDDEDEEEEVEEEAEKRSLKEKQKVQFEEERETAAKASEAADAAASGPTPTPSPTTTTTPPPAAEEEEQPSSSKGEVEDLKEQLERVERKNRFLEHKVLKLSEEYQSSVNNYNEINSKYNNLIGELRKSEAEFAELKKRHSELSIIHGEFFLLFLPFLSHLSPHLSFLLSPLCHLLLFLSRLFFLFFCRNLCDLAHVLDRRNRRSAMWCWYRKRCRRNFRKG